MPFIVVDEGNVVSERMAFLPKMAENQAVAGRFLDCLKMDWSANEMRDRCKMLVFTAKAWGLAKAYRVAREA